MSATIFFILVLVAVIIFYIVVGWQHKSYISDINFINLDKDTERRAHMESQLTNTTISVHRWAAVDGAELTPDAMARSNVSESVYSHRKNWDGKIRNAGVVGCWLSHVSLLRHLANASVPDHAAHLVLEDDVTIMPNALHGSVLNDLPVDWDIVYMGITKPNIDAQISSNLVKLKSHQLYGQGNFGTFAYAVRHGSLRTKILPFYTHYLNAIDVQMNQGFNNWNVYAIQPNVIVAESEHQPNSSIDKNM